MTSAYGSDAECRPAGQPHSGTVNWCPEMGSWYLPHTLGASFCRTPVGQASPSFPMSSAAKRAMPAMKRLRRRDALALARVRAFASVGQLARCQARHACPSGIARESSKARRGASRARRLRPVPGGPSRGRPAASRKLQRLRPRTARLTAPGFDLLRSIESPKQEANGTRLERRVSARVRDH